ncbi:unnamed protein product [Porites lobata]|uniref:NADH dehydrogenase subunit 2 n=1 Tax=Porites lobata TaxID=104759 RepID=A0ABN8RQA9_9CNID|nr:unnamed protein product [Porites lobata]
MSAVFLTLGLVDGLKIRYGSASLLYKPCWLAALSLPFGIMGLVLARSRRPSPMLIKAIWSVSVPCIVFSALVVFSYYHFGIATLVLANHARSRSFLSSRTDPGFLVTKAHSPLRCITCIPSLAKMDFLFHKGCAKGL